MEAGVKQPAAAAASAAPAPAPAPRRVECLLIDLDDTLYDTPAMAKRCAENIRRYMSERLGVPAEEVAETCLQHYLDYGGWWQRSGPRPPACALRLL